MLPNWTSSRIFCDCSWSVLVPIENRTVASGIEQNLLDPVRGFVRIVVCVEGLTGILPEIATTTFPLESIMTFLGDHPRAEIGIGNRRCVMPIPDLEIRFNTNVDGLADGEKSVSMEIKMYPS